MGPGVLAHWLQECELATMEEQQLPSPLEALRPLALLRCAHL